MVSVCRAVSGGHGDLQGAGAPGPRPIIGRSVANAPLSFLRSGFESEDDWLDYRLEHHPEFLRRVAEARETLRSGRGVRLEDLPS
jgi:hypothetical protein